MSEDILITVIVCTRNRADLLRQCLLSVVAAHDNSSVFEVIVVDNGSTDHTESVVNEIASLISLRYMHEEELGLSFARNRAAKVVKTPWMLFLDDDGRVFPDVISQAKACIKDFTFEIVSGIYHPWYQVEKPDWMPVGFGSYHVDPPRVIRPIQGNHLSGGIMLLSKKAISQLGFFPAGLGMSGHRIGYGEDTYIQYLAKEQGIEVGLNPHMQMYHLVAGYKLSVRWILKADFARNRDLFFKHQFGVSTLIRKIFSLLVRTPQYLSFLLYDILVARESSKKSILKWIQPLMAQAGKIAGFFKYHTRSNG